MISNRIRHVSRLQRLHGRTTSPHMLRFHSYTSAPSLAPKVKGIGEVGMPRFRRRETKLAVWRLAVESSSYGEKHGRLTRRFYIEAWRSSIHTCIGLVVLEWHSPDASAQSGRSFEEMDIVSGTLQSPEGGDTGTTASYDRNAFGLSWQHGGQCLLRRNSSIGPFEIKYNRC